jgi:cell division ATPase FtsA
MGIFSWTEEKELALVFDIGSSSVGGALFWMQKSGTPKIIFSIREPIGLEKQINFENFLTATLKSLETVSGKILSAGLGAPDKVFCTLSSPWYVSQSRIIRYEKNAPFIFNTKLADSLIEREVSLFEESHIKEFNGDKERLRPIELKNMKTTLNGYATIDPINQQAKELEMTIFVSVSSEDVLNKLEKVINNHFARPIRFFSFALSSFTVVRDMFVYQDNFLLIHIGGEVTDITMIKKNVICESISFPMGRNFMIRGMAEGLNCSLDEARSMISLYKDEHSHEETKKKIEPVIEKLKSEWLAKFQDSLINLSNDISIPSNIFITVDQDLARFFSDTIKTEQFNQYSLTESKFRVIFLGTEALHGIAVFTENVVRDAFLIIEAIYINRFLK